LVWISHGNNVLARVDADDAVLRVDGEDVGLLGADVDLGVAHGELPTAEDHLCEQVNVVRRREPLGDVGGLELPDLPQRYLLKLAQHDHGSAPY
jgi:hypothetical protein